MGAMAFRRKILNCIASNIYDNALLECKKADHLARLLKFKYCGYSLFANSTFNIDRYAWAHC